MRILAKAAAAALCLMPVAADAMTVQEFLTKMDALKARGAMAIFSSDVGLLQAEGKNAIAAWQADKDARKAAGKPPLACAPKGTKMNSSEVIAAFRTFTPAQRQMSVKQGMFHVFQTRFPCP